MGNPPFKAASNAHERPETSQAYFTWCERSPNKGKQKDGTLYEYE